ncbi:hypothetical protein EDC04DRAFT_2043755 [Pisolithus marmoratus]|nr:hypothetical protein EDC04DRAFT_2043755 [Pisolithus marmoratus]
MIAQALIISFRSSGGSFTFQLGKTSTCGTRYETYTRGTPLEKRSPAINLRLLLYMRKGSAILGTTRATVSHDISVLSVSDPGCQSPMPTLSGLSHLSPSAPRLILELLLCFQNPVLSLLWLSLTRRRLVHCAYVQELFHFLHRMPSIQSTELSTTHCFSAILCCPIFVVSSFILVHLYDIIGSCYHSHQHSSCYRPEPEQLKRKIICSYDVDTHCGTVFDEE